MCYVWYELAQKDRYYVHVKVWEVVPIPILFCILNNLISLDKFAVCIGNMFNPVKKGTVSLHSFTFSFSYGPTNAVPDPLLYSMYTFPASL